MKKSCRHAALFFQRVCLGSVPIPKLSVIRYGGDDTNFAKPKSPNLGGGWVGFNSNLRIISISTLNSVSKGGVAFKLISLYINIRNSRSKKGK